MGIDIKEEGSGVRQSHQPNANRTLEKGTLKFPWLLSIMFVSDIKGNDEPTY